MPRSRATVAMLRAGSTPSVRMPWAAKRDSRLPSLLATSTTRSSRRQPERTRDACGVALVMPCDRVRRSGHVDVVAKEERGIHHVEQLHQRTIGASKQLEGEGRFAPRFGGGRQKRVGQWLPAQVREPVRAPFLRSLDTTTACAGSAGRDSAGCLRCGSTPVAKSPRSQQRSPRLSCSAIRFRTVCPRAGGARPVSVADDRRAGSGRIPSRWTART